MNNIFKSFQGNINGLFKPRFSKKTSIFTAIGLIVLMAGYYYFNHPAINLKDPEFLPILFIFVLILLVFISIFFNSHEKVKGTLQSTLGIVLGLIIIGGIGGMFFTSKIFHAKLYSQRIKVEDVKFNSNTLKEVDFSKTPIIDRKSTIKLGDKVMGEIPELVSQFEVSDAYTQISYKNSVYRVTPLEYPDFIKYFSNQSKGIPGYILVNSTNGKAQLVKLKDLGLGGMKYVPSAYFNHNLQRKLQLDYPTTIFGSPSFEIDEEGHPWYVCTTYGYYGVGTKKYVNGMILFDPITGHSKKYKEGEFPKWVDRVYPEDLVIKEIDDNGSLKRGYLNSVLSQKNVTYTSDGYNYLEKDGDIWIYSGITSANTDSSNLGFVLTNLRTHKTLKFACSGANEKAAMESAEGEVKNYGYKATFPLLVNVSGNPVYLLSLKDNGGLVKQYAMVDAKDYQRVVVYSADTYRNLSKLQKSYIKTLSGEEITSSSKKETIKIKTIRILNVDEKTKIYLTDTNNKKYKIEATSSNEDTIAFLKEGDNITIQYIESDVNIIKEISKTGS